MKIYSDKKKINVIINVHFFMLIHIWKKKKSLIESASALVLIL